jgi:hypothetical protein
VAFLKSLFSPRKISTDGGGFLEEAEGKITSPKLLPKATTKIHQALTRSRTAPIREWVWEAQSVFVTYGGYTRKPVFVILRGVCDLKNPNI